MTRLKRHQYFTYGAPALAQAAMLVVLTAYLPKFYMDEIGVPAIALGAIVLFSRVWDALIDPAMGRISDSTRFKLGRRRPWMAAATLPLIIVFLFIMMPPEGLGDISIIIWAALLLFLFFIFWTMWSVPYESLGAELSMDYNERTRLMGTREGLFVAGTILAAVVPVVVGAFVESERDRFRWLGWMYGAMTLLTFMLCVVVSREKKWRTEQFPRGGLIKTYREVWKNRPFRILVIAYTIGAVATALPATLIFFYVEYVLGSERADTALALYFVIGFCFLPFWIKLAEWWDKKAAWILSMAINVGAFIGISFLGSGDFNLYLVLVGLSGIGLGGTLALPSSMQADVIDYDESETGERREGMYIGFWSVARKMAGGVGAGAALAVLSWAGYEPNSSQPVSAVWALRILYAVVPSVLSIIAIAIAWKYPIDRALHNRIRTGSRKFEGHPGFCQKLQSSEVI